MEEETKTQEAIDENINTEVPDETKGEEQPTKTEEEIEEQQRSALDGLDLTEEQKQAVIDQAIKDGTVVDYETRFKPIYGALKHAERNLTAVQETKPPEQRVDSLNTPPVVTKEKPKYESFESEEEYIEALTDWKYEQRESEKLKEKALSEREENQRWLDDQISRATAKDPDFDDNVFVPEGLMPFLIGSEKLIEIGYHYGQNPQEAIKLAQLAQSKPWLVAKELGKLEATLEMPQQRSETKAPPSTKTVNGKPPVKKSIEDMDYQEYKAHRLSGGT